MAIFEDFLTQTLFLLSNITWFGFIDLILVTAAFYFILSFIYRSTSGYLLRQIFFLGVTLIVITSILPLPVFDWIVRGFLLSMLIAIPIIFQAQLRQFFERTGRLVGVGQIARGDAIETVLPEITDAVETMAGKYTGALIVIEGNQALDDIIKTGIRSDGRITTELLQSVFYDGTPLHDGAIIVRDNKVAAAGCVLPLTQKTLSADKRLGTRHRAAVGMSETSDALVIVVSEETGQVSAALDGTLHRPLTGVELREKLLEFYNPRTPEEVDLSLFAILKRTIKQFARPGRSLLEPRQILRDMFLLMIAFFLALMVWSFVIEQVTPMQTKRIENVALTVTNIPENSILRPVPPRHVVSIIQTFGEVLPTLSSGSFKATAILNTENQLPGLYRLPIELEASTDKVMVLSVEPEFIDVEIIPIITRTMPVQVLPPDQQDLSPAYAMASDPTTIPSEVIISGPKPNVEQVAQVQTSISLDGATSNIEAVRPLRAVDENNNVVPDITINPDQVEVVVYIQQRADAKDVSINPVIQGPPPLGYWLSTVRVVPTGATIRGHPKQLTEVSFINTLPVDITNALGPMSVETALDIPADVEVTDSLGKRIETVIVEVDINARIVNDTMTRPIKLLTSPRQSSVTVEPETLDLLISGYWTVLQEINDNPDLVQVWVQAADLPAGQSTTITPTLIVPSGITVQSAPPVVVVTVEEEPSEEEPDN